MVLPRGVEYPPPSAARTAVGMSTLIAMSVDESDRLTQLLQLTGKIAMELVYAQPGKDSGLLPINCLLDQIEEIAPAAEPPPVVREALGLARKWLDGVFETTGLFDATTLSRLGEWSNWLTAAWEALNAGGEVAPMPPGWAAEPRSRPRPPVPRRLPRPALRLPKPPRRSTARCPST